MFKTNLKIFFLAIAFLAMPILVWGQADQEVNFNIDSSYDLYAREEISATLIKTTEQLYFYIDSEWWDKLDNSEKREIDKKLYNLGDEFERKIYPTLTQTFGSEWKPGIDGDSHITVLIHRMKGDAAGYSRTNDEYSTYQVSDSNQREMFYLNSKFIKDPLLKSFVAHEFTHLIAFNQKERKYGISDEIWLSEARSEYAPTLLGYDDTYEGSNLERRVKGFLEKPNDSLTEWLNETEDYGIVNLFTQYLVDRYGVKILVDSLKSAKIGIASINEALAKNGFKNDFSQIFSNWAIAVLVNDCKLGEKYCYSNSNLKDLRLIPTLYYLPRTETTLSTHHNTTYWSGNWHKFIGGGNYLVLEFDGADSAEFRIPYLLCDSKGDCLVESLTLDNSQNGKITLSEFNKNYSSLIIVPFIENKISGFDGPESYATFSWKVSTGETPAEAELIKQLLARIDSLRKEIARVQAEINAILESRGQKVFCSKFENNLYYGMMGNSEVRCLQEFLKSKGTAIYPEGLVTGNYLSATLSAVKNYQASKGIIQTGYFGPLTRAAANNELTP